jgi:hypothetical protein
MNPSTNDPISGATTNSVSSFMPGSFEDTLRLIAHAPIPHGLADRVQAGLQAAPRTARILFWPAALNPGGNWMRVAAAAAIVFVVAGGGWGVYSRVQTGSQARIIARPPHVAAPGGFSNAGAMRTPQTLNGPVLTHPAVQPQPAKPTAKVPGLNTQKAIHRGQTASAKKAADQPILPVVK